MINWNVTPGARAVRIVTKVLVVLLLLLAGWIMAQLIAVSMGGAGL